MADTLDAGVGGPAPPADPTSDGGRRSLAESLSATAPGAPDEAPPSRRLARLEDDDDEIPVTVADPLLGMIVADRYRILEGIGRGGMGIVYKVEHIRIGKLLAMKLLAGELTRNPEVVRRFKREALTASRLSSPNTVQMFDFGVSDGLTYLVMELVSGEDLGRVLRAEGPMPFQRLAKIVIQVCNSLAEAHAQGIVHRDIKPENIMIVRAQGGADLAKVLDFGLAKLRESSEHNAATSQGAIVGTPYYMAPEQVRGEGVDQRVDIYALGAVMYRALTGQHPFTGATPMAVFSKHLHEMPVPPSVRAPEHNISPGVSRIVMQALAKDPADRFQRVEDLQAALIAEARGLGSASVDELLDSASLRRLTQVEARADSAPGPVEIATRDEVEAYERKLRRMRYTALGSVAAVFAVAGLAGVRLYESLASPQQLKGLEAEPNDAVAEAGALPLGQPVSGYLGKRPEPGRGDRDFYAIEVPAPAGGGPAHVQLSLTALPNFAVCALIYRAGMSTALGQYCAGRAGRDLLIPALRLDPGRYLVAVLQDMAPYGGQAPLVHENVSDRYTLTLAPSEPDPEAEIEPNDKVASANPVQPGKVIRGALAWSHDEDVYCVPASTLGSIRWGVRDGIRDHGVVLEATPMIGVDSGVPVRIHLGIPPGKAPGDSDVQNPWVSPEIPDEGEPRCLRLRLVNDVWNSERGSLIPSGSSQPYTVEIQVGR